MRKGLPVAAITLLAIFIVAAIIQKEGSNAITQDVILTDGYSSVMVKDVDAVLDGGGAVEIAGDAIDVDGYMYNDEGVLEIKLALFNEAIDSLKAKGYEIKEIDNGN